MQLPAGCCRSQLYITCLLERQVELASEDGTQLAIEQLVEKVELPVFVGEPDVFVDIVVEALRATLLASKKKKLTYLVGLESQIWRDGGCLLIT